MQWSLMASTIVNRVPWSLQKVLVGNKQCTCLTAMGSILLGSWKQMKYMALSLCCRSVAPNNKYFFGVSSEVDQSGIFHISPTVEI